MQREEKQLENALDSLIQRVNDVKTGIHMLLFKIENEFETLSWPSVLDSFALISGHMTVLSKMLSHEKCPLLRNLTVLPLLLSPECDENLAQMTENRLQMFSHDIVPDYLRTKLEPICETKMAQLDHKASNLSFESAQKQIATYQKLVTNVWEIVNKAREDWESELSSRTAIPSNNSMADTQLLVSAISTGKNLKPTMAASGPGPGGLIGPQTMMGGPGGRQMLGQGPIPPNAPPMMKAPTGIKTNIKSAAQMSHYLR